MAQRLSMFTNLEQVQRCRTRRAGGPTTSENHEAFLFATAYHAALNYGDAAGSAYLGVSQPVLDAAAALGRLHAERAARPDEPSWRPWTWPTRPSSRRHTTPGSCATTVGENCAPSKALDADVTNGSLEQSATAVLDKISGAVLIGARQRQARTQLLSGVVEQLLVESKRARDTEAAAMNMQLVAWRDRAGRERTRSSPGPATPCATWRQP